MKVHLRATHVHLPSRPAGKPTTSIKADQQINTPRPNHRVPTRSLVPGTQRAYKTQGGLLDVCLSQRTAAR